MNLKQIAVKGTTQEHLPLEDIKKNLIILKDGSCVMILETSSVNFDLLSEREQEAMIYAYAALINSLTFPIQVVIRSTLKDVSNYLNRLKKQEVKIADPLLRKQIVSYRQFVEEVVKKNNVLAKSFYIIIPFYSVELGIQAAAKASFPLPQVGTKKKQALPMSKDKILEKAEATLEPKKEHLIRLFGRLGLSIKQLETKELIRLFYQIYNQESILVDNLAALSQGGAIIRTRGKLKKENEVKLSQSDQAKKEPEGEN